MSIAAVSPVMAFGIHLEFPECRPTFNCIHFVDDKTIIYPAGGNLVYYEMNTRTQKFIPLEEGYAVNCVRLSNDRKWLVIAEMSSSPLLVIYEVQTMRKRKTLRGISEITQSVTCAITNLESLY
jgi:hypothetical protein